MALDKKDKPIGRPGSPELIEALNKAYRPVIRAHEQMHEQESIFGERYGYKRPKHKMQSLVDASHDWRHDILRRIIRREGMPDSQIGVKIDDDIGVAFGHASEILTSIHDSLKQAVAVAQSENDNSTVKLLFALLNHVDCKLAAVERIQRQIKDMGSEFLITAV